MGLRTRLAVMVTVVIGTMCLLMILTWGGRVWDSRAQKGETTADGRVIIEPPPQMIETEWVPLELERLAALPQMALAGPASDSCETAAVLSFSFSAPGEGGSTIVNQFTEAADDPPLSCIWGGPTRREGYRTAWYVFTAPDTGEVTIETSGTNYDTVLTVSTGQCTELAELACSDDVLGFQSRVRFNVVRGTTYYVEAADWQSGVAPVAELRLSAVIRPLDSRWRQVANIPSGGLSRHATAVFNEWIYVIGGEEIVNTIPVLTNRAWAFNTRTNLFTELTSMPGSGYANTTAALLNGKIYLPGGYNGNNSSFDPTHWVYDITTDFWSKAAPIPQPLLQYEVPYAWAVAAVVPEQTVFFLAGGLSSQPDLSPSAQVVSQTLRYEQATNSWSEVAPMDTARYAHSGAWIEVNGRGICVAGGLTTDEDDEGDPITVLLTDGECYNPRTQGGWTPTGPLNFPRYNAASVVGPDGKLYLYGGLSATGAVPETEVYDPATNTWLLLDGSFILGGLPTDPARAWPRGGIVGSTIYAIGGNTFPVRGTISLVDQLRLPPGLAPQAFQSQMPLVALNAGNTFLVQAIPLTVGLAREDNFIANEQFYNAYYFDWPAFGRATVYLTQIPDDWNLDLAVYNSDKQILGDSTNLNGQDEFVSLTLAPGRYYVVVRRLFPPSDIDPSVFYRIIVQQ